MADLNVRDNVVQNDGTIKPLGTLGGVEIRINPDDNTKAQYKTPNGEWQDFSSGGGATLLWSNPVQTPSFGQLLSGFTLPNVEDYDTFIFECYRTSSATTLVTEWTSCYMGTSTARICNKNTYGGDWDVFVRTITKSNDNIIISNVNGTNENYNDRVYILHIWGAKIFN